MKSIEVKLENRTVVVKKLPLGKYAEVFETLQELPKEASDLAGISKDELFTRLPQIVATFLPEVAKVLSVAAEVKYEEIMEMGLDEAVDLLGAVIEVNNFAKVVDSAKKMMARQPQPAKSSTGSTEQ